MRFPKLLVASLTSVLVMFILPIIMPVFEDFTYFQNVFMYALYAVPVIFTYGIVTSYISESLSDKMRIKNKRISSFIFHITFGLLFVLPYGLIVDTSIFTEGIVNFASVTGICCSIIFFR